MNWHRHWSKIGMDWKWEGASRGPTKEEELRMEFPDLKDKYETWQEEDVRLSELSKEINTFKFYEKIIGTKEYKAFVGKVITQEEIVQAAKDDYNFMEKMVRDYD